MDIHWGLVPFHLSFSDDMESNLNRTFSLLKVRRPGDRALRHAESNLNRTFSLLKGMGMIKSGDPVIALSDMLQSIQVMNMP
ncbi:hypothetical protein EJB05_15451, partial [Eragrostis curvula]